MVELHFKAAVCPCATAAISQLINQLMDRKYFSNYICVLVVFCFGLVWFFLFPKMSKQFWFQVFKWNDSVVFFVFYNSILNFF